MAVAYGKNDVGKATRLHSLLVRSRGRCEKCGSTQNLQCAHIIKRRFSAVRTDETNAWCLCASCHFRLETHPDEHVAFAFQTIGPDAFHSLKERALAGPPMSSKLFWRSEVERLQARCDELGLNPKAKAS